MRDVAAVRSLHRCLDILVDELEGEHRSCNAREALGRQQVTVVFAEEEVGDHNRKGPWTGITAEFVEPICRAIHKRNPSTFRQHESCAFQADSESGARYCRDHTFL